MKITIVEREIQDAIRAYIRTQISVNEGMEINMTFTATRGEDGLTAAIDISPAPEPVASSAAESVRPRSPRVIKPVIVEPAPQPTEPQAQAPAAEPVVETEVVEDENPTPTTATAHDPDEPSEIPGDQPLKPSIFANLRRPTNSEAGSDAA